MKKYLLVCLSVCGFLTACAGGNSAVSEPQYKGMTNEWPQAHCRDYSKNTMDERTITSSISEDGKFGFEVCATHAINPNKEYTGPVAVRVMDRYLDKVIHEEKWASYRQSPNTLSVGAETIVFDFSDGVHDFQWGPSSSQLSQIPVSKPQVLDYPNCIRDSEFADAMSKTGFMFEYCYTAAQGAWENLKGSPGIIRLTSYPGGREIKMERVEKMDVQNVQWQLDQKKILFENSGQREEWPLLPSA